MTKERVVAKEGLAERRENRRSLRGTPHGRAGQAG